MGQSRFSFGSGALFMRPTSQGSQPTNPTPVEIAILQDMQVEFSWTVKALKGRFLFPVDEAVGEAKITIKAKHGGFSNLQISALTGESISAGRQRMVLGEAAAIPATPYQVTVANAAHFTNDWGVTNAATALPLTRVASGPIAGQYAVNETTGVYTFAAADTGNGVLIFYEWIDTVGTTVALTNNLQGFGPVLEVYAAEPYRGDSKDLRLFSVIVTKFGRPTKQGDYVIGEIEGEAFANASGAVGEWYEG